MKISTKFGIGIGIVVIITAGGGKPGHEVRHEVTGILDSFQATPETSSAGQAAIRFARHQIGCPYQWGGNGPCSAGFDCSGLVTAAYASAGVTIPRTTFTQWTGLPHVASPGRGDLVYFAGSDGTTTSPGHVGLVLGPHRMIEAYASGYPVRISTFGLPSSPPGDQNPVGFTDPAGG